MRHPVALAVSLLCILLGWCVCAFPLDPSLDVNQYAHTAWKVREGFSQGEIEAIAQTPDGYVWFGTDFGLLRFDGVRRVPWEPPQNQHLPSGMILSLLAARDGTLWIGTQKGLASWKAGNLREYPELAGQHIFSLLEDREGTVWVGSEGVPSSGRLCSIENGRVRCTGADGSLGMGVSEVYEDRKGNLWAVTLDGVWRWKPGSAQYFPLASDRSSRGSLAESNDGTLLLGTRRGIWQIVNRGIERYTLPGALQQVDARKLLRDRDGGLWIGTLDRGLLHVHGGRTDVFASSDGLSGDTINDVFEDHEGNIWVATVNGLDRFRNFAITTLTAKQGLSSSTVQSVLSDSQDIWLGTLGGLDRFANGSVVPFGNTDGKLNGLAPNSIFQDSRGRIWVSTRRSFGYLENNRFVALSEVPGGFMSIAESSDGTLWLATQDQGLIGLREGQVVKRFPANALGPQDLVSAASADRHGGLWLGFYRGGIVYFEDAVVRESHSAAEIGDGHVANLRIDNDGTLWAATEGGLSRVKDGHIATLNGDNGLPCNAVHWSVEDNDHAIWLYTPCGLLRIARSEMNAWTAALDRGSNNKHSVNLTVFDSFDGVRTVPGVGVGPQVAKSADGKLWFLPWDGVSVIDPHHIPSNNVPPPVHVEQIAADGKSYDLAQGLRLPPRVQHIDIEYAALSLMAPEKNRFRIKLEGYDRDWREVGDRRQAFYTNLPPRNYKFRVMASNNSGVWNETGAALEFAVLPAFYQTNWFRALCLLVLLALLWGIYQLRIRQMQQQFNIGLEARVNERTRIARELHDTLLQNFHGLMFQFQAARNLMTRRPEEAMQSLDDAINETKKAIAQSRDAIQGLRSEPMANGNLAELLTATSRQFADSNANERPPVFDLIEEGDRQTLSSTVSDEICRIALELMRNAYEHAQAQRIESEIRYGDTMFRLRIRDDGRGIDPKVLKEGGRTGHWGLRGVRERADRIGATLDLWSEPGGGTEAQLLVPAKIAYENVPDSYRAKLVRKVKNRAQRV